MDPEQESPPEPDKTESKAQPNPPAESVPETKPADFLEIQNLEAVQLFSQHARRVRPDFRLDENNIAQVLEICRLVDGLPLAIELAAVWVRALSLTDLAGEIAGSLDVLSSQRLDLVERQDPLPLCQLFQHGQYL